MCWKSTIITAECVGQTLAKCANEKSSLANLTLAGQGKHRFKGQGRLASKILGLAGLRVGFFLFPKQSWHVLKLVLLSKEVYHARSAGQVHTGFTPMHRSGFLTILDLKSERALLNFEDAGLGPI